MATTVANLEVKISFDDSELSAGLGRASADVEDFGKNAARLKNLLKLQTANILAGLGKGVGEGIGGLVKSFSDLETAVSRIKIVSPELDVKKAMKSIDQLSLRVPVAATEIAAGVEAITQSLDNVPFEIAAQKAARFGQVAHAIGADSGKFTDAIVGALAAFKLNVGQADLVTNNFLGVIDKGIVKPDELAHSFSSVAKAARAAGQDLNTVGASIVGVTAEAGSALRNLNDVSYVFQSLSDPKAAANLKSGLGIDVFDKVTGKARPVLTVFEEIRSQLRLMDDETKKATLASIFPGTQAQRGAFTLIQNLDRAKASYKNLAEESGRTDRVIKVGNSTFASQAQLLTNAFESFKRTFGAEIVKELIPLMQVLGKELPGHLKALRTFLEAIPAPVKRFAVVFGVLLAALAPVITVIAGIGFAVAAVGAWPIIIGAALVALVALFVSNWGAIKKATVEAWSVLTKAVSDGAQRFRDWLNNIIVSIKMWWHGLTEGFSRAWESIKGFFGSLGSNLVGAILNGLRVAAPLLFGGLAGIATKLIDVVKKTLGIKSPSTVFRGIGQNVGEGLAQGISSSGGRVRRTGEQITANALRGLEQAPAKFRLIGNEMANGLVLGMEGNRLVRLPVADAEKRLRAQAQKKTGLTDAQKDDRRAEELIGRIREENAQLTRSATEAEAGYVASVRLATEGHKAELAALVRKNEALKNQQSLKQRFADIVDSLKQQIAQVQGGEKPGRDLSDFNAEQQKVIRSMELQLQKSKDLAAHDERQKQIGLDLAQAVEAALADEQLKIEELTGATTVHTLAVSLLGKTWLKATEAQKSLALAGAAEILQRRNEREEIEAIKKAEKDRAAESQRTSETLLNSLNNARAEFARLTATTNEQTVSLDLVNKGYFELTEEQKAQVREVLRLRQQNEALTEARRREAAALEQQQNTSRQLVNYLDDQTVRMRELLGLESYREKVIARLNLGTKKLTAEQQKGVDQAVNNQKFIDQAERTQNTIKQVAERVGTVFGQALNKLQTEGFGSFFSNILAEFENLLVEMAQELLKSEFTKLLKGLGTRLLQPKLPTPEQQQGKSGDALKQAVTQDLGAFAGGKDPLKDALALQKQTITAMQAGGGGLGNPTDLLGGQFGLNLAQGAGAGSLIDKLVGGPGGQGGVGQSIATSLGKAGTDVGNVLSQAITTSGGDLASTATSALQSGGGLVASAITSTGAAGLTTSLSTAFATGSATLTTTLTAAFAAGAATLAASIASASAAGGAAGAAGGAGGLFGFAAGGRVGGGAPILVGERGPEVFVPGSRGTIVPNDQLGGGPPVNITFNVQTPDAGSFQRSQSQLIADALRTAELQRRRNG